MRHSRHLYRLLDFDKVLSSVKEYALSRQAAVRLDQIATMSKQSAIETALARVMELKSILLHEAQFPLHIHDIEDDLESARVPGAFLACGGMARIVAFLQVCGRIRAYFRQRQDDYPLCWAVAQPLASLKDIGESIKQKIDLQALEVRSSASRELGGIRKKIAQVERRARKELERLFAEYSERGFLQESVVTLRDGRLVFPVKAEHRRKVAGVAHDQSSSGATVFVEPAAAMDLNNELQGLKDKEEREVEKILRELTALLHPELPIIAANLETLLEFDFILAKARFAERFACNQPSFNRQGRLEIANGRHPLLLMHKETVDAVVPLDLQVDGKTSTLIISGPNAGGKSVALKTVGLFALMLQCGIPIPADPDSTFPIFEQIFADIGDSQSIENDLSTFTSHLETIRFILEKSNRKSLVLLDEIGAATDPAEGSALSIAILQHLAETGCKTLVTTHHASLKVFASRTEGVMNASLEFDAKTLGPTYRFKAGVPGSSYALEISRRMGIQASVLQVAENILGSEKTRLEDLIIDLEAKTQAADKLAQQLEIEKAHLADLTTLYNDKLDRHKKETRELKREAMAESQRILSESNKLIEQAVREIKEKQAARQSIAGAKQAIRRQSDTLKKNLLEIEEPDTSAAGVSPDDLQAGRQVLWQKQNKTGRIVAVQDDSQKVLLQVGNMKVWVPAAELAPAAKGKKAVQTPSGGVRLQTSPKDEVLPQIDVRGQRLEEAIGNVDKFLDDALLAGWAEVRVVHGKGTGALRKGLSEFLAEHPRVKQQKSGAWNEGDLGVTIVDLD